MPIDDLSCFREVLSNYSDRPKNPELFNQQLFWRIREPKTLSLRDFYIWAGKGKSLYSSCRIKYKEITFQAWQRLKDRLFMYKRRN